MKLEDIKFIPIYVRYILPFFELASFKLVSEILEFKAKHNQIDAYVASTNYKYISCAIFIISSLLVLKYRSKLAIFFQLIVFLILCASIGLDDTMNYRIPH